MTRYIRTPEDPRRSAKVQSDDTYPGTHNGQLSSWVLAGPDSRYAQYDLGNFSSQRLIVAIDSYGPGGFTDSHIHDDCEQMYFVVAGQAEITIGDETRRGGRGASGYMPPGVPHAFRNVGEETLTMAVISAVLD
jgi:mannose-6-phosphate isomerase-like protein (cupin superfamily)